MSKKEFLETLRQSLAGEVKPDVIEQNIKYYDQYINGSEEEQQRILSSLGDPRLIAKSVIEAERAAKEKGRYTGYQNSYDNYHNANEDNTNQSSQKRKDTSFLSNTTWRQKLTIALVLIFTILFVIFIGRIILGLLFAFGIPIILLLLVFYLFRKR